MDPAVDLVPLFSRHFELSRVQEDEVVAVLSDTRTRADYSLAASVAARQRGAMVLELSVPGMGWNAPGVVLGMGMGVPALTKASPLLDSVRGALMAADLIADLTSETILHTPLREDLLVAGKRILTIVEAPDVLERMFPPAGIKQRVLKARARLETAKTLRVTSGAGTDIRYDLIPGSGIAQYGFADEPGHWDNWPSALISSYPVDGKGEGRVVLAPGDIPFPFKHYLSEPVTLHVEDGYIRSIRGGLEADLIKDFLERWKEPELYALSHIGFGLHPKAQWSALDFYGPSEVIGMDGRSVEGGFIFSTGPNRYVERWSEVHLDVCMRNVTAEIDGEEVLREGQLVGAFAKEEVPE